jgi:hypothetical protein
MRTPFEAVPRTVRADDARPAQPGQNGSDLGVEAGLATLERGIERAPADAEAEQLKQQAAQPPVAEVMDEAQVHRQRDDIAAERRTRLQPLGQWGQGGAAAPAAVPGVALHSRHHRGNCRQVDLVEAACQHLVGPVQRRLAVRAAGRASGDGLVRVGTSGPNRPAGARRPCGRGCPDGGRSGQACHRGSASYPATAAGWRCWASSAGGRAWLPARRPAPSTS